MKKLAIDVDSYRINSDTTVIMAQVRNRESEQAVYQYAFSRSGEQVTFQESGKPYSSLPRKAKKILRAYIEHEKRNITDRDNQY